MSIKYDSLLRNELSDNDNIDDIKNMLRDEAEKCIFEDFSCTVKVIRKILSLTHSIQQEIFWNKFYKFIKNIKTDPEFEAKFAAKIANAENKYDYARRIITIIDKIEEEQKIDYIINATRALCWDNINYNQYFRICLAIEKTFIDDLLFIKKNYDKNACFPGTIEAVSLTLNGLMYQYINVAPTLAQIANPSEINDNAPKTHRFTELGSWVYNMALNYEKDKYLK